MNGYVKCSKARNAATAFCIKKGFDKASPNFSTASVKNQDTTVIGINGSKDLGRTKGWQTIFSRVVCKAKTGMTLEVCIDNCKANYPAGKERRLCKKECKNNL